MNNNSASEHPDMAPQKITIISLLLGIISLTIGVIYVGTETLYIYIEKHFFIFFPFAIICGIIGIRIGMRNLKSGEVHISMKILSGLGITLSGLGIIISSLILFFGLYTAGF